jgi:ribosomal protein S18 acetylase RimI-like enzyme
VTKPDVDPSVVQIRLLTDTDSALVAAFDCDDADLNGFLRDDALRLQQRNTVLTYLAIVEDLIVGYVSMMVDAVVLQTKEKKLLFLTYKDHPVIPALKIARLGCHKPFRDAHRGLGTLLMQFAAATGFEFAQRAGCRLLTLDAYPSAIGFYESLGFVRNRAKELRERNHPSMRLDLFSDDAPQWLRQMGIGAPLDPVDG